MRGIVTHGMESVRRLVWLLCAAAVFCASPSAAEELLPAGVRRVSPSELRIERDYIGDPGLPRPVPQGLVDANPPWLHVQVPLPAAKAPARREKWNRRFYFKLSQDPRFTANVIQSGPKRWSFYNPYTPLARGTWYWTYGLAPADAPDSPVWVKDVFSFTIDDRAFTPPVPPTADEALAAIKRQPEGPIAICRSEDIGKILPDQVWPELAVQMRQDAAQALEDGKRPVRIEISDQDYPAHLGENPKESYFMVQLRALFTGEERRTDALLRGYLLTGDDQFKRLGVQRAIELEEQRLTRSYSIAGREIPLSRPAFYNTVPMLMLDAFSADLPESRREMFSQLALSLMDKRGQGHPHLHDQLEHAHFNQHDWQGDIKNLLVGAAVLCRHRPEFEDWFRYAYELWLYRAPALSRTDGGSLDGNGYLAVHDEPLTHVNWMLYRLTGYNYFRYKRWYASFPVYMSFINVAGNPGAPYSDGGDSGPAVPYLTEMLALMCPDNPAHLWRLKTLGCRDATAFSDDLVKGYRAMDLLLLWRRFSRPNLAAAEPPAQLAAVFRDVGLAAMHSDLGAPSRNLMVNFSSAPNGSFQHLHPSQNAFCIAYGGHPLFWRTGYYNGGQAHDALSYKASRAHNTLLADGLMQGFDLGAYGWLPRFATSPRISYVLGDASRAYNGMFPKYGVSDPDQPLAPGQIALGVPITRENGFGKPGVTRFRRHLVMLRPRHVLIYDELEAARPITWTFTLHSLGPIKQFGNDLFAAANEHAAGYVRLFSSQPVVGSVTDQFFAPAVDDENKRGGHNPPNWHAAISTRDKQTTARFLTVIEVVPGKSLGDPPVKTEAEGSGRVRLRLGEYQLTAELEPGQPSFLEVTHRDGDAALVTGQAATGISVKGQYRPARHAGSTLLWERLSDAAEIYVEEVDRLPDVLIYGNRY